MLRTSQGFHSPLTNTLSANVAIFVSHCGCMLTDHLHDDQHLCRYIDEISCALDCFSLSFHLEKPSSLLAVRVRGLHLLWVFDAFCVLANHSEMKQQIHDHLSSFSYFYLPLQSHPHPRPTHTPSPIMSVSLRLSGFHLRALQSVWSRGEWRCFAVIIIIGIRMDETWLIILSPKWILGIPVSAQTCDDPFNLILSAWYCVYIRRRTIFFHFAVTVPSA